MKKLMLMASGILFALAPLRLVAQEEGVKISGLAPESEEYNDTLVVRINSTDKMLLIGDELKEMVKYRDADSVKQLFLSDYDKAIKSRALARDVQVVHYFVHASGKRRMKAENPDYSDSRIDVAYEIKRLNLDLPKFAFIIHDLKSGYEMQFYLSDPLRLDSVINMVSISEALQSLEKEKKEMRRSYKLEMASENNLYKVTGKTYGRTDAIELSPSLGVGLLGNVIAPVAGFDLTMRLTDKYSTGKIKTGLGWNVFPFVSMAGGEIASVHTVQSYDLKFALNISAGTRDKEHWIGVQGGLMKSDGMSAFNNAYKVGLLYETGGTFNYSFDFIKDGSKSLYGLTVKIPF